MTLRDLLFLYHTRLYCCVHLMGQVPVISHGVVNPGHFTREGGMSCRADPAQVLPPLWNESCWSCQEDLRGVLSQWHWGPRHVSAVLMQDWERFAICSGVMGVQARNAFCAVRPPGHHAGPTGVVKSGKDNSEGSHGFCIFNNVAIGASYAMNVYRHRGAASLSLSWLSCLEAPLPRSVGSPLNVQ